MSWVLWDIFLPVATAFVSGLFFGWLMWRWRRQPVDPEFLEAVRRYANSDDGSGQDRYQRQSARIQQRRVDHPNARGGADSAEVEGELASAKKRIDTLRAELKGTREEIVSLRASTVLQQGGAKGVSGEAQSSQTNKERDLEARLQSAQRKISELQSASRETGLKGSTPDKTPLLSRAGTDGSENAELYAMQERLDARDKLIKTLQESLAQYGADKDSTVLAAEVALRDQKINALETLLDQTRQNDQ